MLKPSRTGKEIATAILRVLSVSTIEPSPVKLYKAESMNPDDALQEQIRRYQRMTGEERLLVALRLHELSCNIAREGIRQQNPGADEAKVERLLRQRLQLTLQ